MSKDYRRPEPQARGGGSSLLIGILIGLVLGLVIALGVAWYINKMPSPFLDRPPLKSEPAKAAPPVSRPPDKAAKAPESKPRFDFYKILPGREEPATDQQVRDAQKKSTPGPKETFFLQAGAFQNAPDAENLKARLALIGVEATIQTTTIPDKGVWHRVRVGPYTSVEALNRTRDNLRQNGVETALIKVRQ
jgi:cell division protein FtsN